MIGIELNQEVLRGSIAILLAQHGAEIPPVTLTQIALNMGKQSPYDVFNPVAEALYAAADSLPEAGLQVCLGLTRYIETVFGPMISPEQVGDPARAALIIAALRRRLGELSETEAPSVLDPPPYPAMVPV